MHKRRCRHLHHLRSESEGDQDIHAQRGDLSSFLLGQCEIARRRFAQHHPWVGKSDDGGARLSCMCLGNDGADQALVA